MEKSSYFELAELVEKQADIIKNQADTIAKLVNENAEKENMLNELMKNQVN